MKKTIEWQVDIENSEYEIIFNTTIEDDNNCYVVHFQIKESGLEIAAGSVKWDGCMNINFPHCVHFCDGAREIDLMASLLKTCLEEAKKHFITTNQAYEWKDQ